MALCGSGQNLTDEEIAAKKTSEKLDSLNLENHVQDNAIKKLLLLGAGESGKSTLFKQAIAIYGKGYTDTEISQFTHIIYGNVIQSMKTLVSHTGSDISPVALSASRNNAKSIVEEADPNPRSLKPEVVDAIIELWGDVAIQEAYQRRARFQLNDSTMYFMGRISDIRQSGYKPNAQDILRSRQKTSGIVETGFTIDENIFRMYDVGGQRNERKKWIHCFESVTAVLFVAAISEYDQQLFEDENTNRMVEALNLFQEICNSKWFKDTAMILFLNKSDLFQEKILSVPITRCPSLADYDGPEDEWEPASEYIKFVFESMNENPSKVVYTHVTCATDTENIRVLFNIVKDIVIRLTLQKNGFL